MRSGEGGRFEHEASEAGTQRAHKFISANGTGEAGHQVATVAKESKIRKVIILMGMVGKKPHFMKDRSIIALIHEGVPGGHGVKIQFNGLDPPPTVLVHRD